LTILDDYRLLLLRGVKVGSNGNGWNDGVIVILVALLLRLLLRVESVSGRLSFDGTDIGQDSHSSRGVSHSPTENKMVKHSHDFWLARWFLFSLLLPVLRRKVARLSPPPL
jgi:hypothetical protein